MKILSIDWDYFVKATHNQRYSLFPDGGNENIGEFLSNIVWQTRYVQVASAGKERIEDIGVDEDAYNKIICSFKKGTYYISCDSHKELGNFILYMLQRYFDVSNEIIEIVNIDHHSDCYGIGDELNCGNWLNKVFERYPTTKLTWVGNDDSSFKLEEGMSKFNITSTSSLDCLEDNYDVVFLCRSGVWSPPHLDKRFRKLDHFLSKRCEHVLVKEPMIDRWPHIEKDLDESIAYYKNALLNMSKEKDDETKGF